MLNFDRNARGNTPNSGNTPKDAPKQGLKPALYEPPATSGSSSGTHSTASTRAASPPATGAATSSAAREPQREASLSPASSSAMSMPAVSTEGGESRLSIGPKIKLKGVEISDCDVLVIEGHVEATVFSKTMEIAEPGTLQGTALIDVAEIHGVFTGELTARTRLVVHGTGRVSGTIRYGKLVVEEGGEMSGDIQRISERDAQQAQQRPSGTTATPPDLKLGLSPQVAAG
jgi:cytoskeletal protein CcmA (bactofilin family)